MSTRGLDDTAWLPRIGVVGGGGAGRAWRYLGARRWGWRHAPRPVRACRAPRSPTRVAGTGAVGGGPRSPACAPLLRSPPPPRPPPAARPSSAAARHGGNVPADCGIACALGVGEGGCCRGGTNLAGWGGCEGEGPRCPLLMPLSPCPAMRFVSDVAGFFVFFILGGGGRPRVWPR